MMRPLKGIYECLKNRFLRPLYRMEDHIQKELEIRFLNLEKANEGANDKVNKILWTEYYNLNQLKLKNLREKVKSGKTVKVFFLVTYAAKFECKTIYEAMEKSDLFEPFIFVIHPRDRYFDEMPELFEEAKKNVDLFQQRGYRSILGYNEWGKPLFLDYFRPDIIFYNNPNLWMWSHYNNLTLNASYLTCFMSYFMDSTNLPEDFRFYYRCNNPSINTAWKVFEESYYSFYGITRTLLKEEAPVLDLWAGQNVVLSGFPKLDLYFRKNMLFPRAKKLKNEKPTIIYAPHWSIRYLMRLSTFHLFGVKMLEFAKAHPEYNFVFKPHPELRTHIGDLNNTGAMNLKKLRGNFDMTLEQYDDYIKTWDNLPNGVYIDDDDYIGLFKSCSVLITDSVSFIQEFLPSKNPCIYILNPEKENPLDFYGELGKKVLSSYYLCSSWCEIVNSLKQILEDRLDPKREEREKILAEEYVNLGTAGQFITDYITQELKE